MSSIQWMLLSGLRRSSVGADTIGYMRTFDRVDTTSWGEILNAFVDVYVYGRTPLTAAENFLYKDSGYLVFQKIVHIFTDNSQVYLFIVAVIFFTTLFHNQRRNQKFTEISPNIFKSCQSIPTISTSTWKWSHNMWTPIRTSAIQALLFSSTVIVFMN